MLSGTDAQTGEEWERERGRENQKQTCWEIIVVEQEIRGPKINTLELVAFQFGNFRIIVKP